MGILIRSCIDPVDLEIKLTNEEGTEIMEATTEQKVVINVVGKTASGNVAPIDPSELSFASTDPVVGEIVDEGGVKKLRGLVAGSVAVVVTFTRGDLVIVKTSESVTVTVAGLVDIEVSLGPIE